MSRSLSELRDRLTSQLTEPHAASHMAVEDFERGVERVEDAANEAELLAVARDLSIVASEEIAGL